MGTCSWGISTVFFFCFLIWRIRNLLAFIVYKAQGYELLFNVGGYAGQVGLKGLRYTVA